MFNPELNDVDVLENPGNSCRLYNSQLLLLPPKHEAELQVAYNPQGAGVTVGCMVFVGTTDAVRDGVIESVKDFAAVIVFDEATEDDRVDEGDKEDDNVATLDADCVLDAERDEEGDSEVESDGVGTRVAVPDVDSDDDDDSDAEVVKDAATEAVVVVVDVAEGVRLEDEL